MKKLIFLGVAIFLALAGFLTYINAESSIEINQSNNFGYTHSYTKAICDENNFCGDYEIVCNKDKFVSAKFTGAAVQFSQDWEDPRGYEIRNGIC
ncbi:MAG: hypothetical protein KKC19_04125 [Nanoarchaeota archaeon]|nr:hypothetical protein [Nanoarchaeota archaeon]